MKHRRSLLILAGLVLALGLINWEIQAKEETLTNGRIVLMKLRPVDPRSLMQGDYMRLAYDQRVYPKSAIRDRLPKRGKVILKLDNDGVAQFARPDTGGSLSAGEIRIKFKKPNNSGWIGDLRYSAKSFFFQEGQAKYFGEAKYAILRVDKAGQSVLAGLADKNRNQIRPPK